MSFRRGTEKRSAKIFGKEIRPKGFREMDKYAHVISQTQVPLEWPNRLKYYSAAYNEPTD